MSFLKKIKTLVIFLLIKFFSKLDRIIYLTRINKIIIFNFEQFFSYLLLNSNHPSRIHEISKKLKRANFWTNKDKSNDIFFIYANKTKKKIYFIGDSQAEYLSRTINDYNDILSFNSKSLWLGPSLVIGLNSGAVVKQMINKISLILNNKKENKIAIITLGTIDIRAIFYEFIITKTVKNEKELFTLFRSGLENFIKNLKPILKKKGFKKIGIIEIFNADKKGLCPKNYMEIKKIKKRNPFPTFGSKRRRELWTIKTNKIIRELAKKNMLHFISNQVNSNHNNEKILKDGVHLSSKKIIVKINESIINIGK